MAKDPAFLFYPGDFMMGTMLLTMEEKGQYITLLSVMHQQGRLSPDEVAVVIGGKPSQKLAAKFKVDESGLWYNERLEVESEKRRKFSESRRNSLNIDNNDQVHIYILHDPTTGYFKIGSSKYPMLRLGEMQKKNPAIELYWKSECLVVRSIEKELHEEFRAGRIKNDWFDLSVDDVHSIIDKTYFRTDNNNTTRTESRTENENRDRDINVVHIKKVSAKKVSRGTEKLIALPFNSDAFTFAWNEWNDYRLEIKKKLTSSSAKKQLAKLSRFPEHVAIEMINQSIEKGWTGLFNVEHNEKSTFNKNDRTEQNIADVIGLEEHIRSGGYSGN